MVKKVFLLAVAFLLFSCEKEEEIPADILSEEKMVETLIEVRILEGQVVNLTLPLDSAETLYGILEAELFQELDVDSIAYMKSYEYYMTHPAKFERIAEIVIDSLKVRQQKY
ncbi:uncharacterized protein DUF4296 [Roseivirga pacifica]|uniref:DUF4296 domain-containing protein n=1 Tax=Roseivirga pacifica TaxID=1267423 RepID=A0A1I0P8N6_9BACT|nr:DUF4296 domain-containing protein [Roseivirga pacifica]MCO6375312.1 DUF4296 domain-containing protein [Roseivirga pacifica]RKQ51747.1 uncharacterized protein DUF4296 [Roseivirga pacifica]SEW09905.1 protein of unknown function [Roseivirga pacifica]